MDMKAFSSAVSITVHVVLGAAALVGTAKTNRSDPVLRIARPVFFQPASPAVEGGGGLSLPAPIRIPPVDVRSLSLPATLKTGALVTPFSPLYSGAVSNSVYAQPGGSRSMVTEEHAEVLSGPLPVYPELLREAGVQ